MTSCTIITMPAAEPMRRLHDRQPAILDPAAYDAWLDPATPAAEVKPLLDHNLDGELQFYRVDREGECVEQDGQDQRQFVDDTGHSDSAAMIEPL